jgi:cold shock protein
MTIGTVRWFDAHKGYGFIKPDDGGVDVMVDICALDRAGIASLDQGQRLGFEVVRDGRIGKSCAENLSVFCDTPRRALVTSVVQARAGTATSLLQGLLPKARRRIRP